MWLVDVHFLKDCFACIWKYILTGDCIEEQQQL